MKRPEASVYTYSYEDWEIVAGKTDYDNDLLSIKLSDPRDYWFHVKGMPGSHVLLKHREGMEADRKTLEVAAAVAAWHSKAKNGGTVGVSCTKACNVKKTRGAKPGSVNIRKETILKVKPGVPE